MCWLYYIMIYQLFMKSWITVLLFVELKITLSESADTLPPPAPDNNQPLTPLEMEILRQHVLANGRWLLGLGKQELRLLGKLTGSDIGGDLLQDTVNVDFIKPDFGTPVNPYQSGYPGTPTVPNVFQSGTKINNENLPPFSPGSINSEVNNPSYQFNHHSSNYTYNFTASFSPSITDPSDEDIVFSPISTSADLLPINSLSSTNDSSNTQSLNKSNSSLGTLLQSMHNTSLSSANSSTQPITEVSPPSRPVLDPLIYPVQFYNQASLPHTKPSDQPSSFNPLASLAETYPDNFDAW